MFIYVQDGAVTLQIFNNSIFKNTNILYSNNIVIEIVYHQEGITYC